MAEPNRLAAALSYEQDRPAFGNPNMLEQGRKMRERKQAEQVERAAQNVKNDLLARALMRRYNPETPPGLSDTGPQTGLTDTQGPQTLDEAAGLDPRVDRSTFLPYSKKEGWHVPAVVADVMKLATASNPQYSNLMQPEEAMPLATNMMGGGVVASRLAPAPAGSLGMNVWHGSPHRFPPTAKNPLGEFDPMKIGTGEGAQAYGVGAGYLAENPQTARIYSADRAYVGSAMQGKPSTINFDDPAWLAQKTIDEFGDTSKATSHLKMVQRTAAKQQSPETKAQVQAAIDLLESGNIATKGNLYKVDLPDEQIAKMLDWDKPLQEMGGIKIKPVAKNYDGPFGTGEYGGYAWHLGDTQISRAHRTPDATQKYAPRGSEIIAELNAISGSPMGHSEMLSKAGIPGIRYLDQGSRAGGAGTSNFVVFDPAHINILERNGVTADSLRNVAPQDEALRLAQQRAALPVEQHGLGLPAGNTPQQRAAAMGFDTDVYHGSPDISNTTKFDPAKVVDNVQYGGKFYTSKSPEYADKYTTNSLRGDSPGIFPLKMRSGKKFEMDQPVSADDAASIMETLGQFDRAKIIRESGKPYRNGSELFYFGLDSSGNNVSKGNAIFRSGFDSIHGDPSLEITGIARKPHSVVDSADNIRSRFAAFDPFRRNAALAAALGVAAPDLLAEENK